ncbi:MAG: hypothetical protein JKZ03_02915, partial [Flavobacteriaceae bacterium]|nr:hypothetical protein [Flavobacteriaceae bacterium]
MKKALFLYLGILIILGIAGYLVDGWKGVIIISLIMISSSILSELFFWKKARKKGAKDLMDIIINFFNKTP